MDKQLIINSIINIIDLKDRSCETLFLEKDLETALREYLTIKVSEDVADELFNKNSELISKVSNRDNSLTIEDYNLFLEKLRSLKRKYILGK